MATCVNTAGNSGISGVFLVTVLVKNTLGVGIIVMQMILGTFTLHKGHQKQ